ncbi:hypothetical protein EV421DRAFT_2035468 [Armillaria borealis]|uniref:Uncharacterized protein n=1 Tax=Armillaria borealis TaxID=47425 RepID=A0AA39JI17_9AGAR|nr:hypothetical protein EV421DRAFT_2035468 [Armillaria borealis]
MDAYCADASEFSSALAVYLFAFTPLHSCSSLSFPLSMIVNLGVRSIASLRTSLRKVVRAARKATIRTNLGKSGCAFGIIAAFIAYYAGLSKLLASETKAVTVLPIRAFYFFNFIGPPFVVHFLIIKASPIMYDLLNQKQSVWGVNQCPSPDAFSNYFALFYPSHSVESEEKRQT